MMNATFTTRVLEGFDDPTFGPTQWDELLAAGNSDVVYLTWHWQRAWWKIFGDGDLMLIVAERNGEAVALAPLYAHFGIVYFVGTSFESGYLDFIGDISDPEILDAILDKARARTPNFQQFLFHFVPDASLTGERLEAAANRFGLTCYEENETNGPVLELRARPDLALAAVQKKDILYHERLLRRDGRLEIFHLTDGEAILPHLEDFFEQHASRWAVKPEVSRPGHQLRRDFVLQLTRQAGTAGWLRFIRIGWNGRPIAFQYGFCYRGRYTREISTFAIDMARHGPGQVLLRQSLLAAMNEGAHTFDFGIGDQPYKYRFASRINRVRTWGIYHEESPPDQMQYERFAGNHMSRDVHGNTQSEC
jgi:CelD/BcsL family acetyltransferase involved in cellulose biosynthesis